MPTLPNDAYTRSPSVTGVSEAWLPLEWMSQSGTPRAASRCHRMRPVLKSRQTTAHAWVLLVGTPLALSSILAGVVGGSTAPPVIAVVRKMRLPHTTGDDQPLPGTLATHATFCVGPHADGSGPVPSPAPFAPLNRGQAAAGWLCG